MRSWVLAMIGLLITAWSSPLIAGSQPSPAPPPAALLADWVEMTATGAQIRAVVADSRCPVVMLDDRPAGMSVRASPRAGFAQTICQLDVASSVLHASISGRALPIPAGPPRRILIFGDTGCRVKGGEAQDCNNPRAWPFALIAKLAAAKKPDLIIHVGDYYYREGPCPTGYAGCAGDPFGDKWDTWRAEFFDPARPLLTSAPWVFVRGNHEACTRGGAGWFRLLDAGARPLACPTSSAPFIVDLGDFSLYVLDSADAQDRFASSEGVEAFGRQLDRLSPDLARRPGWILTHRPVWALAPVLRAGPIGPLEVALNSTEQRAVADRDLSAVRLIVSGHVHNFSAFSFGPARPAQLVAGAGGDEGEAADTPRVRDQPRDIDGMTARRMSFARFGYLILDRSGGDWVGAFRDLDDRQIARCRLHGRDLTCARASAPAP